jgi:hypothetical protein
MRPSARTISIVIAFFSFALAAIFIACETPLDPDDSLTQPRVLGLRSEPVVLAPGGQVTLDALVYAPAGSPAATYSWSWCAEVDSTFECAMSAASLTSLFDPNGDGGVSIDYALGSNATAIFSYPVDSAKIQALCDRELRIDDAGADADADASGDACDDAGDADASDASDASDEIVVDDAGDVDAGVVTGLTCDSTSWTVYVLLTVQVGSKTIQSVRELSLPFAAPTSVNTNPTLVGLAPFSIVDASADATLGAVTDDSGVGEVFDSGITIAAEIPANASDLYVGRIFSPDSGTDPDASTCARLDDGGDGGCATIYESLDFAWYVENGQLARSATTLPAVAGGTAQDWNGALLNRWYPSQSGTYKIIVVVRDDRGGIGWLVQPAKTP